MAEDVASPEIKVPKKRGRPRKEEAIKAKSIYTQKAKNSSDFVSFAIKLPRDVAHVLGQIAERQMRDPKNLLQYMVCEYVAGYSEASQQYRATPSPTQYRAGV
jgi:hypothetical protein